MSDESQNEPVLHIELDDGRVGEVFQPEENGEFYFHVQADNGEILSQSEGYANQEDAVHGLGEVLGVELTVENETPDDSEEKPEDLNGLKKADLVKLAKERSIDVPKKATKADVIALLTGEAPSSSDSVKIPADRLQEGITHNGDIIEAGEPIPKDLTKAQIKRFKTLGVVK